MSFRLGIQAAQSKPLSTSVRATELLLLPQYLGPSVIQNNVHAEKGRREGYSEGRQKTLNTRLLAVSTVPAVTSSREALGIPLGSY